MIYCIAGPSRRTFLRSAAAGLSAILLPVSAGALEDQQALQRLLVEHFGEEDIQFDDRVTISLPALAENGNSVNFGVQVDSPMLASDHVMSIDVLAPKNPQPHLLRALLYPSSGIAALDARIRLAGSQPVAAVARMSDGRLHGATAQIVVTEAACLDFLI